MSAASTKHYLLVLILLTAAAGGLIYAVEVEFQEGAPVVLDLPDRIGDWTGETLFYCVKPGCNPYALRAGELDGSVVCPDCGEALGGGSRAEVRGLPKDTIIRKKEYQRATGERLVAAVVLSGRERASIHRPQVCLTVSGQEIVKNGLLRVKSRDGRSLRATMLDLVRPVQGDDGRPHQATSYYAYWFVGKGHETPYHLLRMFWMASDRVLHSRASRWAYVSVSGKRVPGSDAHLETVRGFLRDFHPLIRRPEGGA